MNLTLFTEIVIYQCFLQETSLLLNFVRLQSLVLLFFSFFSVFCKFQSPLYKDTLVLTFIIEIFYFTLVWSGLKSLKLKRCFITYLQQTSNAKWSTHAIALDFSQRVNKSNWKSENLKVTGLVVLQQLRKL